MIKTLNISGVPSALFFLLSINTSKENLLRNVLKNIPTYLHKKNKYLNILNVH